MADVLYTDLNGTKSNLKIPTILMKPPLGEYSIDMLHKKRFFVR